MYCYLGLLALLTSIKHDFVHYPQFTEHLPPAPLSQGWTVTRERRLCHTASSVTLVYPRDSVAFRNDHPIPVCPQ